MLICWKGVFLFYLGLVLHQLFAQRNEQWLLKHRAVYYCAKWLQNVLVEGVEFKYCARDTNLCIQTLL